MRGLVILALLSTSAALPAAAQGIGGIDQITFDAGLGVSYGPEFPGSDDNVATPWIILRNATLGTDAGPADGFSILPSFNYVGKRDTRDYDALQGLDDIDRAGEVGVRLKYLSGPYDSYATIRKGFGGHSGWTGEIGTKFRIDASERLTLWTGAELELGDDKFTNTYFGVSNRESLTSGYAPYNAGSGIYAANVSLEARYMLTPATSILGEVTYGRLLNDAGNSPVTQDRGQPSISVGVARQLNFRF